MTADNLESFREVEPGVGTETFTGYREANGTVVRHGRYQYTSEDGLVLEEGELSHGMRNGVWKQYHENGQLASLSEYRDGEQHGRQKSWYEDGTLESEADFEDNVNHGILRSFYSNGKIREEAAYEDGEKTGTCKVWDDEGNLLAQGVYRDDLPLEGTFIVEEPIEPSEDMPDFGDYMEAFLSRGFMVVEYHDGRPVRPV